MGVNNQTPPLPDGDGKEGVFVFFNVQVRINLATREFAQDG
jgi:hypothetical protein